jgi:hypothetical protein
MNNYQIIMITGLSRRGQKKKKKNPPIEADGRKKKGG